MFRPSRAPVTTALLVTIAVVIAFEILTGIHLSAVGGNTRDVFERREYWRLLTAMFLHANVLHWFVNSFSLLQLGLNYERMFGSRRFAAIYFLSGICASIVSALHLPPSAAAVGASGAIFGILGAFITSIRRSPKYRTDPNARGIMSQLVFWAVANVAIGFQYSEIIDNWGHMGGLIAGLALGMIPHRVPPPPPGSSVIDVKPRDDGTSA